MSGYSGSNKGGFTIIRSNTKGDIRLDGLFNIVAYDAVPKLQGVLVNSDFKVSLSNNLYLIHAKVYFTLYSGIPGHGYAMI